MITKKEHQEIQSNLYKHLMSASTSAHMSEMLEALLTPGELKNIAIRLEIAHLLRSGMTQRDIAKQLGVGIATVTRGSRELKAGKFKV